MRCAGAGADMKVEYSFVENGKELQNVLLPLRPGLRAGLSNRLKAGSLTSIHSKKEPTLEDLFYRALTGRGLQ